VTSGIAPDRESRLHLCGRREDAHELLGDDVHARVARPDAHAVAGDGDARDLHATGRART
jgi:hypothetical protein